MTGQRRRFPRNATVIRLELMADDLRQWSAMYSSMIERKGAARLTVPALAKAIDRRDTCTMAADLLEKAAVEIYGLW